MKTKGFTLIEIVVVMTIIAILLSSGAFVYIQAINRSKINQALSDIQKIREAIEEYHADMGFYPPDTSPAADPGFLSYPTTCSSYCPAGYNTTSASSYQGPYLDIPSWPMETPWGGVYDYDYWTASHPVQFIAGTCSNSQPGIFISIRSHDWPYPEDGVGAPPPDAEEYFRDRGFDTCADNNGVIYYLIKPL